MKEIKKEYARTGTFAHNEELLNFDFNTSLSAYEKILFVNTVVDTLIDDEYYDFIIKDMIFDFVIDQIFTNIDTSFTSQKDEDGNSISPIIFIEQFLEETNVVDIVKANMEESLLEELNHAVDLGIEYRTGIHPNYLNESLANLVGVIEKKLKDFDLDSVTEAASKFADIKEELTVENLVKAYTSTDMFKNNLAEIEEAKNKK